MSLSSQEQFKKFLENSKDILILIPENPSADAVGSAWALYYFLENKHINPTIAFSNHLSAKFDFLPRPAKILAEISGARDFVLSFDTTRNKIMQIRQEEKDGRFNIMVTPEKGAIDPRDFSFILAKFKYDLVIVIDSSDLETLGKIYTGNTDLFFEVPVVNIDHHSGNDNFGQINLVDITASSSSEICASFFETYYDSLIDETIATCLMTGLIGATESFQKKNTTPKALSLAAALMNRGADQQTIIRWLYKTQPLQILKLWGRAMAKINLEKEAHIVWSELTVEDFVQSRATPSDLPLILDKLEENYGEGRIFMLVYNDTPQTSVALIKTVDTKNIQKISLQIDGDIIRNFLQVRIDSSDTAEVGLKMMEKIKNILAEDIFPEQKN
ncbi:MAG: DHH family phosphoesterase [Parcubacteria group bacterium]